MSSFARKLRLEPTPTEYRFWTLLRPLRDAGWHMRRQCPIGPFIADFACKRAKLIFEIDGDSHFTDAGLAADSQRTAYLQSQGYHVVRFTNLEVMDNPEGVYQVVVGIFEGIGT